MVAHLLPDLAAPSLIPSRPKKISGEKLLLRVINEEGEQWLENVDQTHLVMAIGKLVQKRHSYQSKVRSQIL